MNKEEKIAMLKKYHLYSKWKRNVEKYNSCSLGHSELLLEESLTWRKFILSSFRWTYTKEGWYYWNKISLMEE